MSIADEARAELIELWERHGSCIMSDSSEGRDLADAILAAGYRKVEAAPSDTDEGTFTASNGYKVDRLADGQTKITRANVGAFEHVTWCGGDEYLAIAEHALSRTSQPVQMVQRLGEALFAQSNGWYYPTIEQAHTALSAALGGGTNG